MNIFNNIPISFFILGNPRSGTSLLRLILNSHPNVIVPPESGFLQWWYKKYKNWSPADSLNEKKVVEYISDLLTSKKIEDWGLNEDDLFKEIISWSPNNYGELSSIIYLSYNKFKNNVLSIGDKNNYYIHYLELVNSIYPMASYIHLIRDGRDVACSYKKIKSLDSKSKYAPNLATEITDIAIEWNNNITKIEKFISKRPHITIRYEDLITEPEVVLTSICDFIGLEYKSSMLRFYEPAKNDEPKSTQDWKMKTFEPIDKKNKNKYIKMLSKEEIDIFNTINKDIFNTYGYE